MSYHSSAVLNRRRLLTNAARAAGAGTVAGLLPTVGAFAKEAPKKPRFPYAICNEIFGDWPFEKAFAFAADAGYKGLEIAPFTVSQYVTDVTPKRREEIRRLAESHGLKILGLHWLLAKTEGLHLTSPDEAIRKKTAAYLGELARFCADLGGNIMVFGSPQQRSLAPGMSKEQGMEHAAGIFRAALLVLEKTSVTVALEPLTPQETNFMTTAAEAVELMGRVGSPRVQLHLDTKAMSSEPTPIPDLIRKYRKEMIHFHANDPNRQGPGFGKLDFVPILRALIEIDYKGWVSVEPLDHSPGPERLTRESIAYLRRCADRAAGG